MELSVEQQIAASVMGEQMYQIVLLRTAVRQLVSERDELKQALEQYEKDAKPKDKKK